jgi:hypothetical protein
MSALSVKSCYGCGAGTVREHGQRTSAVGTRYQRAGEGGKDKKTKCVCSELQKVREMSIAL